MRSLLVFFAIFVFLFLPSSVEAREINCAPLDPRQYVSEQEKIDIQKSAQALSRFAEPEGSFKIETHSKVKNLYDKYPNSDKIVLRDKLIYLFCTFLSSTDDDSNRQFKKIIAFVNQIDSTVIRGSSQNKSQITTQRSRANKDTHPHTQWSRANKDTHPSYVRTTILTKDQWAQTYLRPCHAGTWNVIVASLNQDNNEAIEQISELRKNFPNVAFYLSWTNAVDRRSNARYTVMVGHGLTRSEAQALARKAKLIGIAPDAYPTLQPWDSTCPSFSEGDDDV